MLGQVASGRLLIFRASRAWDARCVDEFTTGTSDPGGGTGGGVGGAALVESSLGVPVGILGGGSAGSAAGVLGGAAGTGAVHADAAGGAAVEDGSAGAGMTSLGVMWGRAEAGLPSLALLKSEHGDGDTKFPKRLWDGDGDTKFPKRLWAHGSFITVCSNDSALTTSDTVSSETPTWFPKTWEAEGPSLGMLSSRREWTQDVNLYFLQNDFRGFGETIDSRNYIKYSLPRNSERVSAGDLSTTSGHEAWRDRSAAPKRKVVQDLIWDHKQLVKNKVVTKHLFDGTDISGSLKWKKYIYIYNIYTWKNLVLAQGQQGLLTFKPLGHRSCDLQAIYPASIGHPS